MKRIGLATEAPMSDEVAIVAGSFVLAMAFPRQNRLMRRNHLTCQSRMIVLRLRTNVSRRRSDKSRRPRTKCRRQLEILDFRYFV